ncbi:hypothetical protein [Microbulbifer sp. ZKSA002]|uniref:hypothetical protein n=1 Tax=Microbulbifer sp. ZKSA002 TaxID=3243388 RepID=UPI00403A1233
MSTIDQSCTYAFHSTRVPTLEQQNHLFQVIQGRRHPETELKLLELMSLPASYTKGADAMGRSKSHYQCKTISFDIEIFNKVVTLTLKNFTRQLSTIKGNRGISPWLIWISAML